MPRGMPPGRKGNPRFSFYISKPEMEDLYLRHNFSRRLIAKQFGVSVGTIDNLMLRYGVADKRGHKKGIPLVPRKRPKNLPTLPTKEELFDLRINQGLRNREVATLFGIHPNTVAQLNRQHSVRIGRNEIIRRGQETMEERWATRGPVASDGGYIKAYSKGRGYKEGVNQIAEHRLVISDFVGRPLTKDDRVHHINMVKTDNRLENLAITTHVSHRKIHNYYERVGVYLARLTSIRPAPLKFDTPILWAGKWIDELDLCVKDGISASL